MCIRDSFSPRARRRRPPTSTRCSATQPPAQPRRPSEALTRLRTNGRTGYVTLVAFARTGEADTLEHAWLCLLYTSPSPRD
eukprot:8272681-Alexandrium_andersonii.AAC.1